MLVPIGTLSAGGYSQWKVARILGMSQGCVSIILWGNRYTGSPHQRRRGGRKSLTTTREYRYGQGPMYHLRSSSSARGDDPPIWEEVTNSVNCKQVSGYIYIGLGVPPGVPGWLWITGDVDVCVVKCTEVGTSGTGGTVSSVMSLTSCCFTVMVALMCATGKERETDICIHPTHGW